MKVVKKGTKKITVITPSLGSGGARSNSACTGKSTTCRCPVST